MKPNPVVHFEMGYMDKDRMCKFYESVFGWRTKRMGEDMGGYVLATTTQTDEKSGRPTQPGSINGGFYKKTDNPLSHAPSVVVAVEDIRATMKTLEASGGKILGAMSSDGKQSMEPQMIP